MSSLSLCVAFCVHDAIIGASLRQVERERTTRYRRSKMLDILYLVPISTKKRKMPPRGIRHRWTRIGRFTGREQSGGGGAKSLSTHEESTVNGSLGQQKRADIRCR